MTQLSYDLTSEPFPLQASPATGAAVTARLTVVASNPKTDPAKNTVTLEGLSINIPVGPGGAALTADATGIGPVAPEGWKLQATKPGVGSVEYVFVPQAGQGLIGRQGLVFVFNNIRVNTQPGPCQLTIKEGTPGKPTEQLNVTKFPAGWGAVSFWLNPPDVPYRGSTQLNWAGPTAATYTIQYAREGRVVNVPAQGEPPLGAQGKYPADGAPPLELERTTVFTLNVEENISGVRYQAQLQKTASMLVPPPSISLEASPTLLNASGDTSVTLSWKAENASEVHIGSNFSSKDQVGKWVVTLNKPRSFMAQAFGLEGYSGPPATANVNVGSLVSSDFLNVWKGVVWDQRAASPLELWSFGLGPGRPLFKVKQVLSPSNGWNLDRDVEISIEPGANVLVAYFGKARGGVSSNELTKAAYSPSVSPHVLWTGHFQDSRGYRDSGKYSGAEHDVGNTWGFKSESGALALVWFEGVKPRNQYRLEEPWSFNFGWIDFSRTTSMASRQTDSEAEEGETL